MRKEPCLVEIQPYSTKDLARMYKVSRKTVRRWVKPFENDLGKRNGHYYNVGQVKTIFEKLGFPERFGEN